MDLKKLESAADFIHTNCEALITQWESRARSEVPSAKDSPRDTLRNHLAALLEDLQIALRKVDEKTSPRIASETVFRAKKSELHGSSRAQESNYSAEEVLEEYVVLRQVLTDELDVKGLICLYTVEAINRMFELASVNAVKTFSESIKHHEEKILAALVHDVRSPLSVAIASLEIISEDHKNEKNFEQFFPMAKRSLHRCLDMITGLLDNFSSDIRIGMTFHFKKIDLTPTIREAFDDLKKLYGPNLRFEARTSDPIHGVFDSDILVRVLENLVSNAFKHGASNSPVYVQLSDQNDEVQLCVKNYGDPIPKDRQEEIFEILTSTRGNKQGWGVGLTHVKLAALAHGGKVEVDSSKEEGTIFTLTLKKNYQREGQKHLNINNLSERATLPLN